MTNRDTHDLSDPTFPHGQLAGYHRGCSERHECPQRPSCGDLGRRRDEQRRANRTFGTRYVIPSAFVDAEPARRHVEVLRAEHALNTYAAIARAAGRNNGGDLCAFMTQAGEKTTRSYANDLLRVTEDAVASARWYNRANPAELAWIVRTTQASGFPLPWQAAASGVSPATLKKVIRGTHRVDAEVTARLLMMAASLAGRVANPARPGDPDSRSISHARTTARRLGFHPPACYDDSRQLILDAVPDSRHGRASDTALLYLDSIRLSLAGGTAAQIAAELHTYENFVVRARRAAGLKWLPRQLGQPAILNRSSTERAAYATRVLNRFDAGQLHPVHAAILLGRRCKIPDDHPGLLEWRNEFASTELDGTEPDHAQLLMVGAAG